VSPQTSLSWSRYNAIHFDRERFYAFSTIIKRRRAKGRGNGQSVRNDFHYNSCQAPRASSIVSQALALMRTRSSTLGRFRVQLRHLFYGHRPAAVAFQAGLLTIDLASITYFVATSPLSPSW
jgi:hypothetical protein